MTTVLKDFSTQSLASANKANLFAWIEYHTRSTVAGVELNDNPELKWALTGVTHAFMNHVVNTQLTPANVDERIEQTLARFRSKNVKCLTWWAEPDMQPENLGDHLKAHGLIFSPGPPGMAIDLDALTDDSPLPSGLTIETVNDEDTLQHWVAVMFNVFEVPDPTDVGVKLYASLGFDAPLRHYLGYVDGKPVATSQLFLGAGVAGVYCVTTLPEARGRGVGAALTFAGLRDARAMGYRVAILQATPMGAPVYQRMGFQDTGRLSHYEFINDR
jgi:ribosomal protein S18 acetylase RimI-like enzyme